MFPSVWNIQYEINGKGQVDGGSSSEYLLLRNLLSNKALPRNQGWYPPNRYGSFRTWAKIPPYRISTVRISWPARSIKRGKFNPGKCFKSIPVVAVAATEWCNFGPISRRLTATPPTHTHISRAINKARAKNVPPRRRAGVTFSWRKREPTRNSGVEPRVTSSGTC